jgi:hypothetical protein
LNSASLSAADLVFSFFHDAFKWCAREMLKSCKSAGCPHGLTELEKSLLEMAVEAADGCANLDDAVKKRSGSEGIVDVFNPADHYSLQVTATQKQSYCP